jgi:hypothetical protein
MELKPVPDRLDPLEKMMLIYMQSKVFESRFNSKAQTKSGQAVGPSADTSTRNPRIEQRLLGIGRL